MLWFTKNLLLTTKEGTTKDISSGLVSQPSDGFITRPVEPTKPEPPVIAISRELAEKFAYESKDSISWLPDSPSKKALLELPEFVISRLY